MRYTFKEKKCCSCIELHIKMNPRPYVKDLVHLFFERGKNKMKFKTNYNDVEYSN